MPSKTNTRAFTLVEVLLATLISAMVAVIAFATFRHVTQNRQTLEYYGDIMAHGRYALNLIRNDLANIRRSEEPTYMLIEGTKSERDGHA